MQLHVEQNYIQFPEQHRTLVLIHGLFGSLSNLGMLARVLQQNYHVIQIDLRNHGKSPHDEAMNYTVMAQDVVDTLNRLGIEVFAVIGHSMGAKVAMKLSELVPQRLEQMIILDMAPFSYPKNHHDQIFKALFSVQNAQVSTRKEATEIMQKDIHDEGVILFLLKSWQKGQWQFNLNALHASYSKIIAWDKIEVWSKPVLFICGENSDYVSQQEHKEAIKQQFTNFKLLTINDTGHWLHAEKTNEVLTAIQDFLNEEDSV